MLNYECKIETKSPIVRELTISVQPDSIQKFMDRQFESLQKKAKIKGFRPGKVPLQVLKQYYLQDVKSDVFSKVIQESYLKALQDHKLSAVGLPKIEAKSGAELDGQPLTYVASIEVFPEIELKDLSKIKVQRLSAEVTEKDVENSIQKILDSNAEMVQSDASGPAQTGDFIEINFMGTVDGKSMDVLKGDKKLVHIGSKSYMEEFETALIGLKQGDHKKFDMTFPADFSESTLAGKVVTFEVDALGFKSKKLPALDDEFVKRFKVETVAEFKKKVSDSMKEDRSRESREKLKEAVIGELNKMHDFEIPDALVQSQLEYLVNENTQFLKNQGFTEKMTRDYLNKNRDDLEKRAKEQVRASLILDKVASVQNIKAEQADLDVEYSKISERVNLGLDQIRGFYEQDSEALRQLKFRIKEDRAMDYLFGQVKITDAK